MDLENFEDKLFENRDTSIVITFAYSNSQAPHICILEVNINFISTRVTEKHVRRSDFHW